MNTTDIAERENTGFVLSLLSLGGWLLPIVGIPLSIGAIALARKGTTYRGIAACSIGLLTLTAGGINAYIGARQGVDKASAEQSTSVTDTSYQDTSSTTATQTDYPAEYASNFTNACTNAGGTVTGCYCYLNYVQTNYTYEQALAMETQGYPAGLAEAVQAACN